MLNGHINKFRKSIFFHFFLNIFSVIVLVIFIDYIIGSLLSYFYYKQQSGLEYRTTYSIEKTTADLLIFGSSRASHHYQSEVFEKKMNLSSYNVGRNDGAMIYCYAVLQGVLKRYSPKIVIFDFENKEFEKNQVNYDRISALLPYYSTHHEMHALIKLKSPYEQIKLLSQIYPFNSTILTIAIGNSKLGSERSREIEGYVPLTKEWDEPPKTEDTTLASNQIDSNLINLYESFIKDCLNSKVKLYIVCSPYFIKSVHADYSITKGREIAEKYNVSFFDFSQDSAISINRTLFVDFEHLNDKGAKKLSDLISDKILMCEKRNYN